MTAVKQILLNLNFFSNFRHQSVLRDLPPKYQLSVPAISAEDFYKYLLEDNLKIRSAQTIRAVQHFLLQLLDEWETSVKHIMQFKR